MPDRVNRPLQPPQTPTATARMTSSHSTKRHRPAPRLRPSTKHLPTPTPARQGPPANKYPQTNTPPPSPSPHQNHRCPSRRPRQADHHPPHQQRRRNHHPHRGPHHLRPQRANHRPTRPNRRPRRTNRRPQHLHQCPARRACRPATTTQRHRHRHRHHPSTHHRRCPSQYHCHHRCPSAHRGRHRCRRTTRRGCRLITTTRHDDANSSTEHPSTHDGRSPPCSQPRSDGSYSVPTPRSSTSDAVCGPSHHTSSNCF